MTAAALMLLLMADPPAAAPPPAVQKLAASAAAAREAERVDEALRLYKQAVAMAPSWAEGWWQLGTIYYGRDEYPPCRDAFRRFTTLDAKVSAGFAFLGLCEFQLKELAPSLQHLEKAVSLGLPRGEQLTDVSFYHLALLHTRGGDFERALQFISSLAKTAESNPRLSGLAGIAALRRPVFPHDLPPGDQDLAMRLGEALLSAGRRPAEEVMAQFDDVARRFPKEANVHYTYATFLLVNNPDRGLEELKKTIELDAGHLPALISLAFEYLRRGEPDTARPLAQRAVDAAPGSFASRACLGRVLMAMEDSNLPAAIRELEAAVKLAPDSPQARFSLATAYQRAGRKADAAREQAEFARLKKLQEAAVP